jgi:anti-anti-sigma factor
MMHMTGNGSEPTNKSIASNGVDPRLQLFLRLLDTAPLVLWSLDRNGIFTMAEGSGLAALGSKPGEWVGRNCLEEWKGTEAEEPLRRALAGEELRRTLTLPGPLTFDCWYLPIRDAEGQPNGMFGLALDITDDRVRETELRDRLATIEAQRAKIDLFTTAVNRAPVTIWMLDMEGKILLSEGGVLHKLGMKPGETIGLNALEMYRGTPVETSIRETLLSGNDTESSIEAAPGVVLDTWCLPVRAEGSGEMQGVIGLSIDASERTRTERELRQKLEVIERQAATIRALATPIIRVWDEILCLPVIGTVDSQRTADMMSSLLTAIQREQARYAIVDLTGVEVVDTSTADHLIRLFKAARVLGVEGVLCGIQPAVAQTIVALGMDLGQVRTTRTLQEALRWCLARRASEKASTNGAVQGAR